MFISIKIDSKKKFKVKNIVNKKKINCDSNKKLQYRIKWTEYNKTTWELINFMKNIIILNQYKMWKAKQQHYQMWNWTVFDHDQIKKKRLNSKKKVLSQVEL